MIMYYIQSHLINMNIPKWMILWKSINGQNGLKKKQKIIMPCNQGNYLEEFSSNFLKQWL